MAYQAITRKASVDDILACRVLAISEFRQSQTTMMYCKQTMENAGCGSHVISSVMRDVNYYSLSPENIERSVVSFIRELDKSIWKHMAHITGMDQIMDSTARRQWNDDIEKNAPECTRDTLEATFEQLHDNRKLIFNRGLVKAFEKLSGRYKINDAFKIGKKIIVQNATNHYSAGADYLLDVERVLYVLNGKKPPEHADSVKGKISSAQDDKFETEHMTGKLYQNRNAHVTFTRLDLIDKANEIIAAFYGATLPNDSHRSSTRT